MTKYTEQEVLDASREVRGLGFRTAANMLTAYADLLAAQPVADDMADRVRSCLVCWRCVSCRHELIEMPEDPFGACPACGVKSAMHHVFSIDTEGLAAIANSGPVAQPVAASANVTEDMRSAGVRAARELAEILSEDEVTQIFLAMVAAQPVAVPDGLSHIMTIKYWADCLSDPASDEHFPGRDMVVRLLREYEQLRAILAAPSLAQPVAVRDASKALDAAIDWIGKVPHGDNCYLDDSHPSYPGQCHCGKDSILSFLLDVSDGQPAAEGAKLPPGFHGCTFSNEPQPIGVVVTSEPQKGQQVKRELGTATLLRGTELHLPDGWVVSVSDCGGFCVTDKSGNTFLPEKPSAEGEKVAQPAEVLSEWQADIPDGAADTLIDAAKVSDFHPDGSQREKLRELVRRAAFEGQARAVLAQPKERIALSPMAKEDGRAGYYFSCPELYIDVEPESGGNWSVYVRDKKADTDQLQEFTALVQPSDARAFVGDHIAELETALAESRANDQTAMGYLTEIRAIVGGDDFPDMVKRVAVLAQPSGGDERAAISQLIYLIETYAPHLDGMVVDYARAAIAAGTKGGEA